MRPEVLALWSVFLAASYWAPLFVEFNFLINLTERKKNA